MKTFLLYGSRWDGDFDVDFLLDESWTEPFAFMGAELRTFVIKEYLLPETNKCRRVEYVDAWGRIQEKYADLPDPRVAVFMASGRNHRQDGEWLSREIDKPLWCIDLETLDDFEVFFRKYGTDFSDEIGSTIPPLLAIKVINE